MILAAMSNLAGYPCSRWISYRNNDVSIIYAKYARLQLGENLRHRPILLGSSNCLTQVHVSLYIGVKNTHQL